MLSELILDLEEVLDPAVWVSRKFQMKLDPWQERVIQTPKRQTILNCSRQSGKSTIASLLALHRALNRPKTLILIVSPSLRQSSELFKKIAELYRTINIIPTLESLTRAEFENGSRIISLPGQESTIRGYSAVDLLIVDEASRVPDSLYYSVRPMLATSRGKIVLLSTPFGKRGFFYEIWEKGDSSWEKIKITVDDCPRIPKEFVEEERANLPTNWFLQEYYGEFLDVEDQIFSTDEIEAMYDENAEFVEL